MSVVASELGVNTLEGGITVGLWLFDPVEEIGLISFVSLTGSRFRDLHSSSNPPKTQGDP